MICRRQRRTPRRTQASVLLGSAGSMAYLGRLAVCALYAQDGKHFCIQLRTRASGSVVTMLDGAASMNAPASVSPIGIMVGISAVTMSHICMIRITVMATGRVIAFSTVILGKFARICFVHT